MSHAQRRTEHPFTRRLRRTARTAAIWGVVGGLAITGCSSSSTSASTTSAPTTDLASTSSTPWKQPTCDRPVSPAPKAAAVSGSASDRDITSFDGTKIRAHWFPIADGKPHPTVLMGPGWSLAGDTSTSDGGNAQLLGALGIPTLRKLGYNVLTWDPRGFGASGGTVEVDSADFEGRDVSQLISWVAAQRGVELDAKGDPRMGMVGGSYGGGIQLVTAATDCRVDVIVPMIAWNSLGTSLYKADTVKSGWADILTNIAGDHKLDPHIHSADQAGKTTGILTKEDREWFLDRGPAPLLDQIKIPTLIVQGTVDNLFTLDEGIRNYLAIAKNGVPTSMLWYCGGHGACLTDAGDPQLVATETANWLHRYLDLDTHAPKVPGFATVDQNGKLHTFTSYPVPMGTPATATGKGTLHLTDEGGSGPPTTKSNDVVAQIALPISPAKAANAVNVPVRLGSVSRTVLGAPMLSFTYSGTLPEGTPGSPRVFAQLVDDSTGIVLGNQVTPIKVVLDGKSHRLTVPMEVVAFAAKPGATLTLQLVATTVLYAKPALGGSVRFSTIRVSVPTVK
jgi:ABC-2 type transport system ATP-binding protein